MEIGSNSGARGFRARLVFDSQTPFAAKLGIKMDSGLVQVQDNGRIQETSASNVIDVQFYRGRNVLEVFCDEDCVLCRARLTAMDGFASKGVRQARQYGI